MRSYFLASAAAAALMIATPASAADQFVDTTAPMVFDWTGFYVGLHGGGAGSRIGWQYVAGGNASHSGSGAFGGVQAGYNVQNGAWVFGGEADLSYADIDGDTPCPNPVFSCNSDIGWLGSVRGRAGYAFDNLLLYGTAGLGFGSVRIETVDTAGGAIPPSGTPVNGERKTRVGWTAGAGAEMAFSDAWSVKGEYLYYDLGRSTYVVDNLNEVSARTRVHTFKVGVNFRW